MTLTQEVILYTILINQKIDREKADRIIEKLEQTLDATDPQVDTVIDF